MKTKKSLLATIVILFFAMPLFAQKKTTDKTNAAALTPKYGKYGCTASKYRNGSYEYIPRESFTIAADGKYFYKDFEKPSNGTYSVDAKGDLLFKGGYFDGGKAEKIDRPNKFFLVFSSIPDNRWTCGWIEK